MNRLHQRIKKKLLILVMLMLYINIKKKSHIFNEIYKSVTLVVNKRLKCYEIRNKYEDTMEEKIFCDSKFIIVLF